MHRKVKPLIIQKIMLITNLLWKNLGLWQVIAAGYCNEKLSRCYSKLFTLGCEREWYSRTTMALGQLERCTEIVSLLLSGARMSQKNGDNLTQCLCASGFVCVETRFTVCPFEKRQQQQKLIWSSKGHWWPKLTLGIDLVILWIGQSDQLSAMVKGSP